MKKLLTILLSLVLVFCFISCSQPSDNPEVEQSNFPPINVQSVKKDPNVPASFTAVLEDNDAKLIIHLYKQLNQTRGGLVSQTNDPA